MWKLSQIRPVHSLFVCNIKLQVFTEQFIHGNSFVCPLMLRTNYRCVQSINISVGVAKCVEKFNKFNQYTHFLSVTKNDFSWVNYLLMAKFQLTRMSAFGKNKLKMCSVTQHRCRRRQMCEKCSQIHQSTHFVSVTKNYLSWQNNQFMVRFYLIRMSSYAKNKLLMCSVTQHQCRRHQMCGNVLQSQPVHSLFVFNKKWLL